MGKMKSVLDNNNSLYVFYNSLELGYLSYGVEIWENNYRVFDPIFSLQKKAIRIVHFADFYAPTNFMFVSLITLKTCDIVDLKGMYNAHIYYIQKMFDYRENRYRYSLKGTGIF